MAEPLQVGILGPLRVTRGDEDLAVTAPMQRSLLVLLAVHAGAVLSTDRIIDDLWGGEPPDAPQRALRFHVSRLRAALAAGGGGDASPIVTEGPGYRLAVPDDAIDARRFEAAVVAARLAGDPVQRASGLRAALAMWRGEALADARYAEFAQPEIRRLEELRLTALEDRSDADLAAGRHREVIGELEGVVARHPLRERPVGQLMLALYRSGRQADALRVYRDARRVLGEELGLEPGEELRLLEERILLQDEGLRPAGGAERAEARPAGVVTFLLTDIVGSTRLWEERPEEMRAALALHDELLAAAVTSHGGRVVKHTGDGILGVFASAHEAVAAALAGQRAMLTARWPGGTRPPVRMGLHSGEAERRDDDYFGQPLNRVARIEEVAHGGQVVGSLATAELARDRLPADVEIVDLGEHRLRDLSRPERLVQFGPPGGAGAFPPLHSLDQFRHNLPIALSSFVGRDEDVARVISLVDGHRLVTVHGPGGVGKTRLVLQVAATRLDAHPDGVWLVRLDATAGSGEVVHALAAAVGAGGGGGDGALDAVVDWGRHREAMIVLDNCEHVVAGAADLTARLLEACPGLTLVATSREPLGVPGETGYRLEPLGSVAGGSPEEAGPAIRLFADRARSAVPDFRLTAENLPVIAEICRRLDGIPLAIELAAARMRMLAPRQIAERLEDRFRLLTAGARTALPRHQTLRAAVEWSYDLLDEPQRRLFERLSVFRGGFSLDAAEDVCAGQPIAPGAVLDLLGRLVDRSMVVVEELDDGQHRFALLETLREFAAAALEERAEADGYLRRHAGWVAGLARRAAPELRGPEEARWLRRLDEEFPNIRRAVSWSLGGQDFGDALTILAALKLYFIARDEHGAEVAGWVARVAARPLPDSPDLAGALSTGGVLAWSVGDLDTAERLHQRSLSLARRAGSTGDVFRTIGDLGLVAMDRGRADRARDLFAEGLEIARAEGDPVWLAVALSNLGRVEAPERQHRLLAEALALHREAGRLTGIADVALMLGWLAVARGDLAGAHELFRESLTGWEDLANQGAMVIALCGLADVAALRGSEAGAFELLDRAEDVAEAVDWQPAIGLVLVRRGAIALDRGDGAEAPLRRARDRLEGSGLDAALAHTLGLLARATLPGDPDEAGALLQRSRDVWRALGRSDGMSWCAAATADLTRHRSGEEAALPLYAGALTSYALARGEPVCVDGLLVPALGGVADRVGVVERAADCARAAGRVEAADEALAAAAAVRRRTGIVGIGGPPDAAGAGDGADDFERALDRLATALGGGAVPSPV